MDNLGVFLTRTECPPDIPSDVHYRRMFALIPTTIILILSVLTYALRLYCRRKTGQTIGWDDILMGCGLFISLEPAICEYLLLRNGLGHHICHVPRDQQKRFAVISFALQRANQPALACIKISILLFYLRIFSQNKTFRMAAYINMAYTIGWAISTWIVNLTVCTPIAFYYDHTIKGGSCKNQAISGSVNGGLSLFGDICILILPLPMIWNLKMNTRRKIGICAIFLLGCFICVASIIRIVELARFVPSDATYTQVYASTWTDLEMGVAVISGNLPLLAPIIERFLGRKESTRRYYYYYGSSGRDGDRSALNDRRKSHLNDISVGKGPAQTSLSRLASTSHDFGRLGDTEHRVQPSPPGDMELDDRTILVSTQVEVISDPVDSESETGATSGIGTARSWLQTK